MVAPGTGSRLAPLSYRGRVGGIASRPPGGLRTPAPLLASLDHTNNHLRTDLPTGESQTPATPTPGSPLDNTTFDRFFAATVAYQERNFGLSPNDKSRRYLDLDRYHLTEVVYGALPDDLVELYLDNNYLLELDCALLPKTLELLYVRNVPTLRSIRNLDQLPNLCELKLNGCSGLTTLPALPPSIHTLRLGHCEGITELPPLARLPNLRILDIELTQNLHQLPALPEGITMVLAQFNALEELPYLPDSLWLLDIQHSMVVLLGLAPEYKDGESGVDYTRRTRTWWNACLAKEKFDAIHEELMAAAWHPKRVESWLSHGEEVLDSIMGC